MRPLALVQSIALFCSSVLLGAEPDFAAWLHGAESPYRTLRSADCSVALWRIPQRFSGADFLVSPDGRKYATRFTGDKEQSVEIRSFGEERTIQVYRNVGQKENGFAPLGILWSPDSDQLFVKYGCQSLGAVDWFPHDAVTGKMAGEREAYDKLLQTKAATGDTDGSGRTDPVPTWTLGGKFFRARHYALEAGHRALFLPSPGRPFQSFAFVNWPDGRRYAGSPG